MVGWLVNSSGTTIVKINTLDGITMEGNVENDNTLLITEDRTPDQAFGAIERPNITTIHVL